MYSIYAASGHPVTSVILGPGLSPRKRRPILRYGVGTALPVELFGGVSAHGEGGAFSVAQHGDPGVRH